MAESKPEHVLVVPSDMTPKLWGCQLEPIVPLRDVAPGWGRGQIYMLHRGDSPDVADRNPRFKQIIPYCVLTCRGDKGQPMFLTYARCKKSGDGDARLRGKSSVGFGGHVNEQTGNFGLSLLQAAQRELKEELGYDKPDNLQFLGWINDNSTEVGRVHLGALVVVRCRDQEPFTANEDHVLDVRWQDASTLYPNIWGFEVWSQIAIRTLLSESGESLVL